MTRLQRAVATLRISGDSLVPQEISGLLGSAPTSAEEKGQQILGKSGRTRITRSGLWRLSASDTEPEDLDGQVAELLGKLTNDLSIWRELADRFSIDLFCGWFMGGANEGVEISPATLAALGERGIVLGLDIYGPDTEA